MLELLILHCNYNGSDEIVTICTPDKTKELIQADRDHLLNLHGVCPREDNYYTTEWTLNKLWYQEESI